MLPVSEREFHDFGVVETNFGELPIIMGWVREKIPARMVKGLSPKDGEKRRRERFVFTFYHPKA